MRRRPAQIVNMMTSGVLRLLLPIVLGPLGIIPAPVFGQQVPDTTFRPKVVAPAYKLGNGPLVMVDEAHNNSHTLEGSYRGFAELLRLDGYRVQPFRKRFGQSALSRGNILVIINALASKNVDNWSLPTPSALTVEEINEVREWVRTGGALLLVADHMPFPGATNALAAEFGVAFMNGFAIDTHNGTLSCSGSQTVLWPGTRSRRDGSPRRSLTLSPRFGGRLSGHQIAA